MTWKRTTRPPNRPSFHSSMERTAPSVPCSTNCVSSSSVPWAGERGAGGGGMGGGGGGGGGGEGGGGGGGGVEVWG